MSRRLPELAIVAGLALLGVYGSWPIVENILNGELYSSDTAMSAWALWWVEQQVTSLGNPWFSDDIFAPDGTRLAFHALTPLLGLLWLPVTAILGPGPTANLVSLVAPTLGAYAAYRLALHVGLRQAPAFAAGAFYGFSPIFLGRTSVHVNFSWTLLLFPLGLLAAMRLRERRRVKDAVLVGAIVGACVLIDPVGAILLSMLLALYGIGVLAQERRLELRPAARLLGVVVAAAVLVGLPQIYSSLQAGRAGDNDSNPAALAPSYRTFGTDVMSIVRPNPGARLPDGVMADIEETFSRALDQPATPGFIALILAAIGLVAFRRRRLVQWCVFATIVAVLFALGPRIAIGEHPVVGTDQFLKAGITPFPIDHHGVELSAILPYTWFVQLPGMEDFRVAQRFAMVFLLPIALLAGFGVQALLGARRRWVHAVTALLLVAAVVEAGQFADTDNRAPYTRPAVYDPIARDKSDSIVVDVPLGWVTAINTAGAMGYVIEPVMRAAEHGHPIAYGFTNRLSDRRFDRLGSHPFYAGLLRVQYPELDGNLVWPTPTPPPAPTLAQARADRERLNVGWAVLWPDTAKEVVPYLEATGFRRSHAADGFTVYRAGP